VSAPGPRPFMPADPPRPTSWYLGIYVTAGAYSQRDTLIARQGLPLDSTWRPAGRRSSPSATA
jgi:hypothetical protein